METYDVKKHEQVTRVSGLARLLIGLALGMGIVLGAFLYPRLAGAPKGSNDAAEAKKDKEKEKDKEKGPADVVKISPEAQKDVGIGVEAAAVRRLQSSLATTGAVAEDPARIAHVRALARGLVEKAFVMLGDRVPAGSALVEYDNIELGLALGEFKAAQAELARCLTDLELRRKILERSRALLQVGALAQSTHDVREAEVKDGEAKVLAARAAVAKASEPVHIFGWTPEDLEKLPADQVGFQHRLSHTTLKAPFGGIVTFLHAVQSEVVEPGTDLVAISDMSSLWVQADIYEKDLTQIHSGTQVQVRVASYPKESFTGKITYVADVIDPKTRTAKVRCVVANDRGLLKPEMFANIEIPIGQTSPILTVPSSSIQQMDGHSVVFVRKGDGEFQKREVETGVESQGYMEIRSGLKAGDAVATRGSFMVKSEFLKHLFTEEEEGEKK